MKISIKIKKVYIPKFCSFSEVQDRDTRAGGFN